MKTLDALKPKQITPPDGDVVALDDTKVHLRVEHYDHESLILGHIKSAVADLDGYRGILGRCILNQGWRQEFREWKGWFRLPFPDVSSVTITYQDTDNTTQAVSSDDYEVIEDAQGGLVVFREAFLRPNLYADMVAPISVDFTAGYGAAADVPMDIKVAVMLMVQLDYDQPEPQKAMAIQNAINAKIEKHRWVTV